MTATHATTDRSLSVTTACSLRRSTTHRSPAHHRLGTLYSSRRPTSALTLTKRPPNPAKTTRSHPPYRRTRPPATPSRCSAPPAPRLFFSLFCSSDLSVTTTCPSLLHRSQS